MPRPDFPKGKTCFLCILYFGNRFGHINPLSLRIGIVGWHYPLFSLSCGIFEQSELKGLRYIFIFLLLAFGIISGASAQQGTLNGSVSTMSQPMQGAFIRVSPIGKGTQSDASGKFSMKLPSGQDLIVEISFLGMTTKKYRIRLKPDEVRQLNAELEEESKEGADVVVTGKRELREQVSTITLDPKIAKFMPSPFGDFNKVLATLPGVVSNNELSSSYSVRGGNFNENLVYVNDMEIYRPFLVSSGQQEGLSFVNPDMVKSVDFSSGGFQARYGDRLSSVLNVQYKTPKKAAGSISLGILTQTGHLEGADSSGRISWVLGLRRKDARYLFGGSKLIKGFDVKGEYLPLFFDAQSFVTIDLTPEKNRGKDAGRTTLGILNSFARNRYAVRPASRETQFGTIQRVLRLYTAFEGEESLNYDTWQTGIRLSHRWNEHFRSDFVPSFVSTRERERVDVEGGYRLCDVETNQSKADFNKCIATRGVGTEYRYARNRLEGTIFQINQRNYYQSDSSRFETEFGWNAGSEQLNDYLYEYQFIDSSDFVSEKAPLISTQNLNTYRAGAYLQQTFRINGRSTLNYGIRAGWWSGNGEFILSPRLQYSWKPAWKKDWIFRASGGIYQQQPFYRELRDYSGKLNMNLRSQKSAQLVLGANNRFMLWDREFQLNQEVYGKYLWDVVPYDVDNVRIRYYANNKAVAYAWGYDLRIGGEFIRGSESWFSLGVLSTRENVAGDSSNVYDENGENVIARNPIGFIRRPTDQRVTMGIFFQDHLPKNPSVRMYLNLLIGTGLPFGPPASPDNRATLKAPPYRRVDIGFSKVLSLSDRSTWLGRRFESIWMGVEILNLIGAENTISYTWIKDVYNVQYAVPNTLSTRFLNLRLQVKF